RAPGLRAEDEARREAARLDPLGPARARRSRDARRGRTADRPVERLAHRPGRGADQGRFDRQGVRVGAEHAPRVGRHGDTRPRRAARARRAGEPPPRPSAVAVHHRAVATLRRWNERDPARDHCAARARVAAEVAMHLAPTEEQQAIQQQARRFLAAEIDRERRLAWDATAEGHDAAFWEAVARLGWFGFGLPAQYGGQGASLLELGVLMEECGRAAAPLGIFAAVAGGLGLAALGSPAQRRAWLPAIARGEKLVTLAIAEEHAGNDPAALSTVVRRRGSRLQLDGEKRYVSQGVTADAFFVAARDGRGASTILVPADTTGVSVRSQKTFGKDRQSAVRFKNVVLPASALAGAAGTA